MFSRRAQCSFCERINPPDSKFCNACGAPLHLVPCPHCGAVNDATVTICHQCDAQLPEPAEEREELSTPAPSASGRPGGGAPPVDGRPEALAAPTPALHALDRDAQVLATLQELRQLMARSELAAAPGKTEGGTPGSQVAVQPRGSVTTASSASTAYPVSAVPVSPALRVTATGAPRRRPRVIVATVVVAALAASAYYAYRQRAPVDAPQPSAASGEVRERGSAAAVAGSIVDRDSSKASEAPATSTPAVATPPVEPAATPAAQPSAPPPASSVATIRPGAAPAGDGRAAVVVPPAGAPGATADPPRTSPQARDQGESSAAATPAPAARPRPPAAGPGLEPSRSRVGPCTDVVAALGLCTPEPTQRRE